MNKKIILILLFFQIHPESKIVAKVIKFHDLVRDKNKANEIFAKEIKHEGITVVKFYATWCRPYTIYASIFESFANENPEIIIDKNKFTIKYLSIDVDEFKGISNQEKISSIPVTFFYKSGKFMGKISGNITKEVLLNKIKTI